MTTLRTDCGHERRYRAREEEIGRLVLDAWCERWVITVVAEDRDRDDNDHAPPWAAWIILRRTGV